MYHSFECFQKFTDISKKYHNYSLIHTLANKSSQINQNLPKVQFTTHQNEKKHRMIMILILLLTLQILILSSMIIIIAHQYMFLAFSINKLNSTTPHQNGTLFSQDWHSQNCAWFEMSNLSLWYHFRLGNTLELEQRYFWLKL